MKVLITARPRFPLPPEQLGALAEGFVAWRERYRPKMDAFYFFAGKGGGGGILDVADEAELNQLMLEWPFALFSDVDIEPILDGDVALQQFRAAVHAMAGSR